MGGIVFWFLFDLLVEKYDKASGTFILRCYQSGIRDVLASLLYLDTVRNSPSIIRVMGVNSTQERALMSFNQIINQNKQMEILPWFLLFIFKFYLYIIVLFEIEE